MGAYTGTITLQQSLENSPVLISPRIDYNMNSISNETFRHEFTGSFRY